MTIILALLILSALANVWAFLQLRRETRLRKAAEAQSQRFLEYAEDQLRASRKTRRGKPEWR